MEKPTPFQRFFSANPGTTKPMFRPITNLCPGLAFSLSFVPNLAHHFIFIYPSCMSFPRVKAFASGALWRSSHPITYQRSESLLKFVDSKSLDGNLGETNDRSQFPLDKSRFLGILLVSIGGVGPPLSGRRLESLTICRGEN